MVRKARASCVLLLLSLFLASGAAYAAPSLGPVVQERTPGLLTAIWDWVTSLVEAKAPLEQVLEAAGEILPTPSPSGPSTEGGGFVDPNGNS
jgi:hypothetical protein